jgi:hypothetical protein
MEQDILRLAEMSRILRATGAPQSRDARIADRVAECLRELHGVAALAERRRAASQHASPTPR